MSLFPPANTWFIGAATSPAMQANLIDIANALPRGRLGSNSSAGTVTIGGVGGADVAGGGAVTFVLTETRRVKITTKARYNPFSTAAAKMTVQSGYNSGSSAVIGSVTKISVQGHIFTAGGATGLNGSSSEDAIGDVLLTAGTYTAYPVVTLQNGGASGDQASAFYCLVEDIGAT